MLKSVCFIFTLFVCFVCTACVSAEESRLTYVQATADGEIPVPPSAYDYPFGYPYAEYPLGGASHPRQSNVDYFLRRPNMRGNHEKRIGQYVLRQVLTGDTDEALAYAGQILANHHDKGKAHYLMALSHIAAGDFDAAEAHVQQALETDFPPGRFVAGPRNLFEPLRDRPVMRALFEQYRHKPVHGPKLGRMTDRSVHVWVRTAYEGTVRVLISESPDLDNIVSEGEARSSAETDYTAVVKVDSLKPDTTYYYGLVIDGGKVMANEHQYFKTFMQQGASTAFTVAFGGCAGYHPNNEYMWDVIDAHDPLAMLMLGDNVYIDDPESAEMNRYCYYQRQSRPEYRRLMAGTPVYAIWDDHDFGTNDSWGGPLLDVPYWKPMVLEIFQQNWVNPNDGHREASGVWFDFMIGDVHFIMLDGRYFREDAGRYGGDGVENPTMLGPVQLAWLKQTLAESQGVFKVLVSPVSFHDGAKTGRAGLDTWRGYPEEREKIFSFIEANDINGVVLLSSDRHRSDAWKHERPQGYDFYEFASGQLTNKHRHSVMSGSLFGYNDRLSFGLLHFDTASDTPSVRYRIVNDRSEVIHELTVPLSDLQR